MAILKREGADLVYGVAKLFRERALESDDSLLTPGRTVWSAEALDELRRLFILQPDESKDAFLVKLERQFSGASDTAIQLMAEVLIVHLLITSAIGGKKKREQLSAVLGWMADSVDLPAELDAVMDHGLAHPGVVFNTKKYRQVQFIIEFARSWKAATQSERDAALADPWRFKERLEQVAVEASAPQQNALLHLLYPETFERMVSQMDKTAAVKAFAHLIGGMERAKTLDPDQAILEIRRALETDHGVGFDFYTTDSVRKLWKNGPPEPPPEVPPLLDRIQAVYPGWEGFSDSRFLSDETNYKMAASAKARELLGAEPLQELLDEGRYEEVVQRIKKVGQSTNLLWLQAPLVGDLAILYRQGLNKVAFSGAIYDLLHGEGSSPERLERFATYTAAHGLPTKWALPTYLLMLVHPETELFVKPEATKWFLKQMGAEFKMGSKASGDVYAQILEVAQSLREQLDSFGPQTMLDIQSYLWVAYRVKEYAQADETHDLAPLFAAMFGDWETAWWAFDLAKDMLHQVGVTSPDDERLSVTLARMRTLHVDVARWLLLGFGVERGQPLQLAFAHSKDSALYDASQSSDPFAADESVVVGYLPLADARDEEELLREAMGPAMEAARKQFEGHLRSPYRKHNRPELAEAVFDEGKREKLLREGMTAPLPEESNSSVYDYIAAKGYHFPDWLVTDYVLSLATKPLVILSGISGTGKTKMAQLVSEFVAPAQERESVRTGLPDLGDFSFAHSVGLATLRHNVITIPKSAAALLESLPAPGTSMPVKLRIEGLGEYSARLIGGAYGAANPAYQVRWKKDLQTALAGVVQSGDHLMVRVDSDAQVPAFDVVPVVAERATQTVPSERIAFLSVRPDWTDNRALLGYYNPLLQRYQGTELLRLLLRAQTNPDEPHFVVLDEMNLAKVEYYFSDFLSAMESETEMVLHDTDDEDVDLEMPLPPKRLKVPPNVFFTGTVNVDETTYMFSPKVLDRANTIEFNEVNLASYGAGGGLLDAFRLADSVTLDDLLAASRKPVPADWNGLPTPFKERVREVHALMAEYHLHFGYRVANEIARYLALTAEYIGDEQLDFAFDLQVLQKVLPKLSGSRAKLERPLEALLDYLDGAGLHLSAAKVARMLETVRTVGFVSFVE